MSTPFLNRRDAKAQSFLRTLLQISLSCFFLCAFASLRFSVAHAQEHEHERSSGGNPKTGALWAKSDKAFHDGDYEKAIIYHRQIEEIDPHDVESFSIAAWLMWSLGHKDAALRHIERGLKVNGDNWQMWDEAGQHYNLQAGREEASPLLAKAKNAYARAVELLPADADKNDAQMLRRRLAHAADKVGDLELSLATWKKLVEDYPDDAVNKNNMARVEQKIADKQNESKRTAMAYGAGGAAFLGFIAVGSILRKRAVEYGDKSSVALSLPA
jgi:tetratricopeptide (TPR) repeat protein